MNCPNCGSQNILGSTFCIKCGTNLKEITQNVQLNVNNVQNSQTTYPQQNIYEQPVVEQTQVFSPNLQSQPNYQQSVMNQNQNVIEQVQPRPVEQPLYNNKCQNVNVDNTSLNYFMYIIAVFLKPIKSFKEEENKFINPKTSIIFSTVVAILITLINLVKTMISTVFVKSFDYKTFKMKTSFDFSRLKDLDYVSLIGKNLLIYAGIILAIALVYYLATLIIKKESNFFKLLATSATSVIPFVLLTMVVSPLLGKVWSPLSIVSIVVGAVYTLLIFITLINKDISFSSGDSRVYFNLACLTILGTAGYYVYMKLMLSGIGNTLNGLLDLFS